MCREKTYKVELGHIVTSCSWELRLIAIIAQSKIFVFLLRVSTVTGRVGKRKPSKGAKDKPEPRRTFDRLKRKDTDMNSMQRVSTCPSSPRRSW